ncbi:MAG: translation initiation factor IF-3, partial [Phycisphaerae bacterium]
MDYGKHKYEQKKRQKMAAQAHAVQLKEIRIRPKTDAHDREIKVKHARDFLDQGNKVQFTMLFRGRERFHRELASEIFGGILEEFGDTVKVERMPAMDGRRMTMIVAPVKPKTGGGGGGGGGAAQKKPAPKQPAPPKQPMPKKAEGEPQAESAEATPTGDAPVEGQPQAGEASAS